MLGNSEKIKIEVMRNNLLLSYQISVGGNRYTFISETRHSPVVQSYHSR
jgi:hypothetical protein